MTYSDDFSVAQNLNTSLPRDDLFAWRPEFLSKTNRSDRISDIEQNVAKVHL